MTWRALLFSFEARRFHPNRAETDPTALMCMCRHMCLFKYTHYEGDIFYFFHSSLHIYIQAVSWVSREDWACVGFTGNQDSSQSGGELTSGCYGNVSALSAQTARRRELRIRTADWWKRSFIQKPWANSNPLPLLEEWHLKWDILNHRTAGHKSFYVIQKWTPNMFVPQSEFTVCRFRCANY